MEERKERVEIEFDGQGSPVYSVEECLFVMQEALSRLGVLKVRGEISKVSVSRDAMAFFDLKDREKEGFVVKCKIFGWQFSRYRHLLEEGMEVQLAGKAEIYQARGDLGLRVEEIQPSGEGAWKRALEALKKELEQKGYFAAARKRQLPFSVRTIGLVTSQDGQALHDFKRNLEPFGFKVLLCPVWVEGDKAAKSVATSIQWMNARHPETDVLVVIRGGGGFENLKAFNDPAIAEAIFLSRIPVITGIGHEQDESIADLVADIRCSTPSMTAIFLSRHREDLVRTVDQLQESLVRETEQQLKQKREKTNVLAERLSHRLQLVFEGFRRLELEFRQRAQEFQARLESMSQRLVLADRTLELLHPAAILQRGYSIAYGKDGKVVKDAKEVQVGQELKVQLSKGSLLADIKRKLS